MRAPGSIRAALVNEILVSIAHLEPKLSNIRPIAGIFGLSAENPIVNFPLATFTSLLEAAAGELSNGTFGLSLGQKFKISGLGPVGELMKSAPTVGDAIESFVRYFALIQTNTKSVLSVSGGIARLSYVINDPTVRFRTQDANFTIAMEYAMLRYLLGAAWQPACIEFEHMPGENLPLYQQHFHCPLRFGGVQNALLFPAQLLSAAPRAADTGRYRQMETELSATMHEQAGWLDLMQGVEAWVAAAICHSSSTDIDVAAADFGMSVRSFQRKLEDYHVSYVDVRNAVRLRMSKSMLAETDLPVTEIGHRLGYSETSAFSRAFKLQTGTTPMVFRTGAAKISRQMMV